jgi:hypothetical protein
MRKSLCSVAMLFGCLLAFPAVARAQAPVPRNVVRQPDGKYQPAPGYDWLTNDVKDLRVRWCPGRRHPVYANVVAGPTAGRWLPVAGYKWLNNVPGDLRVVRAGPGNEEIGRAVLKALGAVALHKAGKPRPGDGAGDAFLRALSREGRDKLIDSALEDLFPGAPLAERASVRNLAILALDGRLANDRNRVIAQLRRTSPDMANAVEIAEFLTRLAQAADRARN